MKPRSLPTMVRHATILQWSLLLLSSVPSVTGASFRSAKAPAPAFMPAPPPAAVALATPAAPAPAAPRRMPPPLPEHIQDPPPPPLAPPVRPGLPPPAPLEGSVILPLPGALLATVPTIMPDVLQPPPQPRPSLGVVTSAAAATPEPSEGASPPPDLPADVEPLEEDVVAEALPNQLVPPSKPAEPMPLPPAPVVVGELADAGTVVADRASVPGVPGVRSLTHPMIDQIEGGAGLSTAGQLLAQPFALGMPQTLSAAGFALPASPPLEVGFPTEEPPAAEVGTADGAAAAVFDSTIDTSAPVPQQKCSCCPGCLQAAGPSAAVSLGAPAGAPASSPALPPA